MFITDEIVDAAYDAMAGKAANKDTLRVGLKAALQKADDKNPQTEALLRIADTLTQINAKLAVSSVNLGGQTVHHLVSVASYRAPGGYGGDAT